MCIQTISQLFLELCRQVREMLSYYNPVKVMVRLKIDFDRKTLEHRLRELEPAH